MDYTPNLKSRPNPTPELTVSRDITPNRSRSNSCRFNSGVKSMKETLEMNQPSTGIYDRPCYYNLRKQARDYVEDGMILKKDTKSVNSYNSTPRRKESAPFFYFEDNKNTEEQTKDIEIDLVKNTANNPKKRSEQGDQAKTTGFKKGKGGLKRSGSLKNIGEGSKKDFTKLNDLKNYGGVIEPESSSHNNLSKKKPIDTEAVGLPKSGRQKQLVDNSTQCGMEFSFFPKSFLNDAETPPPAIEMTDKQTQCEIDVISVHDQCVQVSEFQKFDECVQVSEFQKSQNNDNNFLKNASIDWSSLYQDKELELQKVQGEKLEWQSKFESMFDSKDQTEKNTNEKNVDLLQHVQDMLKSNLYDPSVVMKVEDELKTGFGIDNFEDYTNSMAKSTNPEYFNKLGTILESKEDVYNSEIKFQEGIIKDLENSKNILEAELVKVREEGRAQGLRLAALDIAEKQSQANCQNYQKFLDKADEQIKNLTQKLNDFESESLQKKSQNDCQNETLILEKNELQVKFDISEKSNMRLQDELQKLQADYDRLVGIDCESKDIREENQILKISSKNASANYKDKFVRIKNMLVKEGFILNDKDGELTGVNAERDLFQQQYFELKQLTKDKEEVCHDLLRKNEDLVEMQNQVFLEKEGLVEELSELKKDVNYFKQKYEETYITMTEYMFFNDLITNESDLLQKTPFGDRKSELSPKFVKSNHYESEIYVLDGNENQR